MKFRTEIGKLKGGFELSHDDRIVLLGSCFADNVGERLEHDGFNVVHNPLGPLFNPASIFSVLKRGYKEFTPDDFVNDRGVWHCLQFANRYQSEDPHHLAEMVNNDYMPLCEAIENATAIILTFGTNKVYEYTPGGFVAGNCHKLPAAVFNERFLQAEEILELAKGLQLKSKTIFTLSPVRYPGDGLAQGFLSKATLRVAIDRLCRKFGADYFPSYEIVNDDLRDYRFYTSDLRHVNEMAVDYIYEHFSETYFSTKTLSKAEACHKEYLRSAHRPIIK